MVNIQLNGEAFEIKDEANVSHLLKQLNLENKHFAVEINEEIVSRSEFERTVLKNQDIVEIVQAIGGG